MFFTVCLLYTVNCCSHAHSTLHWYYNGRSYFEAKFSKSRVLVTWRYCRSPILAVIKFSSPLLQICFELLIFLIWQCFCPTDPLFHVIPLKFTCLDEQESKTLIVWKDLQTDWQLTHQKCKWVLQKTRCSVFDILDQLCYLFCNRNFFETENYPMKLFQISKFQSFETLPPNKTLLIANPGLTLLCQIIGKICDHIHASNLPEMCSDFTKNYDKPTEWLSVLGFCVADDLAFKWYPSVILDYSPLWKLVKVFILRLL